MRDRILEAAAALFVEQGVGASMAQIAARAGVAAGSLYNHFESKNVLIRAVYLDLAEATNDWVAASDSPEATDLERLSRYIESYIEFTWSNPDRAILFEYFSSAPLISPEEMVATFRKSADFIAALLTSLQESGHAAPGDVMNMGGFIGGAIRNTLKWRRATGQPLSEADRAQIMDMCFRAVGAPARAG
ncbi:MAG: TetR/AcrR family transcriptional regulator [Pikeienuella sp.]